MFHKHNWELIDKTIPPAINGARVNSFKAGYGIEQFFAAIQEHVVHVFKCPCGKVKVVKN